jgi:hypothetical protein
MSHSRFTRAPGGSTDRFVCCQVNGMIITSKRSRSRAATVRLMPSMAIDPLATMNGASTGGSATVSQCASPSSRTCTSVPTPSTCPCTKCPPKRASMRIDRSRFTG